MKYLVEATDKYKKTNTYDKELSVKKGVTQYFPEQGEQWEVSTERKELLVEKGFVKVVKEVKEAETKKEEPKKKTTTKKTTTKTTRKKK